MSSVPRASDGIEVSGSASVTSTRSAGWSTESCFSAGASRYRTSDWRRGAPARPRIGLSGGLESGLALLHAREQRAGVRDEDLRGRCQAHVAAGALEQRHARLLLELR